MIKQTVKIAAGLLLSVVLVAGAVNGAEPAAQLVIKSAEADFGSNQIIIKGVNFGSTLPTVTLGDDTLFVLSATPNEVVTLMPPLLQDASYRLVVSRGPATTQFDVFDFTVAVVGPQGPQGPKGDKGDPGPQGPEGVAGPAGPAGATGPQGPAGPKGDTGAQGATGPKGDKGDTGAIGPQGSQGPVGPMGPQGLQGDTGPQGPIGVTGAAGPEGLTFKGPWDIVTTYNTDDAVSFDGSSWIAKQASLNSPPAENADWTILAQKGDTGTQGEIGPQGPQGAMGPAGPQGPTGATGAQGPAGPQGPQGLQGLQGVAGPTGPTGPQGPQGVKGDTGATGLQGPQGPSTTTANSLYIGSDQDANEAGSTLSFGTDNSPKMTLLESGNVGIGTTSPIVPLHVQGAGNVEIRTKATDANSFSEYVGVNDVDDTLRVIMRGSNPGGFGAFIDGVSEARMALIESNNAENFLIGTRTAHPLYLTTQRIRRFTIDPSGNVGIGTTNPGYKLDVVGAIRGDQVCIGLDCHNSWPNGDITSVNAGTGLSGNTASGDATLSIASSYQLPQLCTNGQVAKSNGAGAWTCANDSDTPYSAGTGLSLTGTTFSLDQSFSVTGTIGAGSFTGSGSGLTSLSPANLSAGTAGIDISGNAATATTATTASTANSATSFSGSLSGDVTGTQSATAVARLRGVNVATTAPTSGQVLKFDGTNWVPDTDAGAGAVTGVTAAAPLYSSGGTTPNVSLPNVIIGTSNTAIGTSALQSNTTGNRNTASGASALYSNTTGNDNTALGAGANVWLDNLTNATAIGAYALVDASNKIRLGDGNVTLVETSGDLRVGAGHLTGCVQDGDGTIIAGTCSSDARLKRDISAFVPLLDRLVQLQPVHFYWKAEEYPERQFGSGRSFGLIAQEAEKLLPELVTEDARGYKAVRYNLLPLMTLQAMKEQQDQIKELRAESRELKTENADLKARLERLEQLIQNRPYLTASAEPVLSKVEVPVQ